MDGIDMVRTSETLYKLEKNAQAPAAAS